MLIVNKHIYTNLSMLLTLYSIAIDYFVNANKHLIQVYILKYCSIMLHVNCKIAVFREHSSTYHSKDRYKD